MDSKKRIIFTAPAHARVKFTAAAPASTDGAVAAGASAPPPDSIGTIEGYALVWGVPSSDRGGYKVVLAPNSAHFTAPTHALYHHEFTGGPLGDTATGTLRILPDDYGVKVQIDLPATSLGRDVAELVRTGRVAGMSFSMVGDVQGGMDDSSGEPIFTATSYDVDEVTVTAVPSFNQTTLGLTTEIDDDATEAEDDADDADDADKMTKNKKELSAQYRKLLALKLSILSD